MVSSTNSKVRILDAALALITKQYEKRVTKLLYDALTRSVLL